MEESGAEIIYPTSVAHLNDGTCLLFTVHVTQPSEELHCFPAYPQAGIRSTPICVSYGLKGAGPFAGDLLRTDMVPMWLLCPMLRDESILQACARILSLHQSFLLRTVLMLFNVNSISFFRIPSLSFIGCPHLSRETWCCGSGTPSTHIGFSSIRDLSCSSGALSVPAHH